MRADLDELLPAAIDEGMRWISPIGTQGRRATRTLELGGVELPADAPVAAVIASANRDPRALRRPRRASTSHRERQRAGDLRLRPPLLQRPRVRSRPGADRAARAARAPRRDSSSPPSRRSRAGSSARPASSASGSPEYGGRAWSRAGRSRGCGLLGARRPRGGARRAHATDRRRLGLVRAPAARRSPRSSATCSSACELALPEEPNDPATVLADAARVLDESNSPSRPLYLGYVGSTGLEVGVLAEALAATYDVNLAVTARAADLVEAPGGRVGRRVRRLPCAEGAFTSGGMISNLTGAARRPRARAAGLPASTASRGRQGAVYCSDEAHHSIVRAAEAAGHRLGLRPPDRRSTSAAGSASTSSTARSRADLEAGVLPVAVVANGGTTLTGAVDPIAEVADVCERHGVWLHVDGAYGLPAAATETRGAAVRRARARRLGDARRPQVARPAEELQPRARPPRRACSRRPSATRSPTCAAADSVRNAVERTLEYSRPLRSLKLWLAFRTHGAAAFRGWIERHARRSRGDLADAARAPTSRSSCSASRRSRPSASATSPAAEADLDAHNAALATAVQDDGRVYLAAGDSSTIRSACASASSTSAPAPRTSTSRWRPCASSGGALRRE